MPPTAQDIEENKILYNVLIELKKPGKDGYPLISQGDVVDGDGHIITIFRSNITGVQLQEYMEDAHNEAHMEKIRCTLLKHIYKLYEERNEELMAWIENMGSDLVPNDLFDRIRINIKNYCDEILTPQSSPGSSPGSSPPRKGNNSDDGEAAAYGGAPASELKVYKSPKKTKKTGNFGWPLEASTTPVASQKRLQLSPSPSPSQSQTNFDVNLLSGKFPSNPDDGGPPSKKSRKLFDDDDTDDSGAGPASPEGGRRKRRTQHRKTKKKRVRSKSRTKHKTKKTKRRHRGKKATKRKSRRRSRK